jgi:hypothetical protein
MYYVYPRALLRQGQATTSNPTRAGRRIEWRLGSAATASSVSLENGFSPDVCNRAAGKG